VYEWEGNKSGIAVDRIVDRLLARSSSGNDRSTVTGAEWDRAIASFDEEIARDIRMIDEIMSCTNPQEVQAALQRVSAEFGAKIRSGPYVDGHLAPDRAWDHGLAVPVNEEDELPS
jgi:hypothetical protein